MYVFFVKKKLVTFMNQNMAAELEDTALLAKTEQGDHIALEAKYHLVCLTKLTYHQRSLTREKQEPAGISCEEKKREIRAFAELVSYLKDVVQDGIFCFQIYRSVPSL